MFVNRQKELEWLKQAALALQNNKGINGAILGLRRIGKTELLLEFRRICKNRQILMPYLNIQSSMSSPKRFCLDFTSALLEEACSFRNMKIPAEQGLEQDIPVVAAMVDENLYEHSTRLLTLLNKGQMEEALRLLFKLPEITSTAIGANILFLIDEFQEIDDLKYYHLDIFSLMRLVIEKQKTVKYIVTGSIISFMEDLFTDPNKPFFNQFSMVGLSYFDIDDTKSLAADMWDYDFLEVNDNAYSTLFSLTCGHPFYIVSVCERVFFECRYNDFKIDSSIVEYAFLKETLDREGKLNILFDYIFNHSLEKVQRKGSLKMPLLILAEDEGLTLSGVSGKLDKPSGQVSNLMKSLLKTDLILRRGNRYYFRDPVLRFWLAKTSLGKDLGIKFRKDIISVFISDLKEKYLRKSTELGRMKEFELYYFINERQGKKIGGIKLPLFRKIIKNYMLTDGTEIDLFALNKESWVFELKWKNKKTGKKEIEKLFKKIKADKYVYISKKGFTAEAREFGKDKGIVLWEEKDIKDG